MAKKTAKTSKARSGPKTPPYRAPAGGRVIGPNEAIALAKYARLPGREFAAIDAWASAFYPFQREWLFEQSKFALCNKSRRTGLSFTSAAITLLWGAFHGEDTTIISRGEKESYEVLLLAKAHAKVLTGLGSHMAELKAANKGEIKFASGGRIIALASTGGRGYTGNVFIDEFAYHQDAKGTWDGAAVAMTLGDARLRVSSTPNGVNEFHDVYQQARKPGTIWALHELPMALARAQGYPFDMAVCWALANGDQRLFDQLFNCSFLDGDLQYIPTVAIDSCLYETPPAVEDGAHYAGLDIGRTIDLSVLIVVRLIKGVRVVVHIETIKRTDWEALDAMVARAFAKYKLKRLCIDATGLGAFPAESIKKQHSERVEVRHRRPRVECIDFTLNSKELLATGMYTGFTKKTVAIPADDDALPSVKPGLAKQLRQDIASIRRLVTASNNVKYDAPHTASGHADSAWAIALALLAVGTPNPMIEALKAKK